jgi:hypothetical protein
MPNTNAHMDDAVDWLDTPRDHEASQYALAQAQIAATLAVAHELRTANMIAYMQSCDANSMDTNTQRAEVWARL